jgi:hypothetical protein
MCNSLRDLSALKIKPTAATSPTVCQNKSMLFLVKIAAAHGRSG